MLSLTREQLYLIFDPRLNGNGDHCELTLHEFNRHPNNPVLRATFPWEKRGMRLGGTVLWEPDNGLFKMWYFAAAGIGYAESKDGIHWEKPALGLFDIEGSEENNICSIGIYTPAVSRNLQELDPEKKYVLWGVQTGDAPDGVNSDWCVYRFFSPDGIRWKRETSTPAIPGYGTNYTPTWPAEPERPLIEGGGGDHSYTYWFPHLNKFVSFHKVQPPNPRPAPGVDTNKTHIRRQFARFESHDGLQWNLNNPTWAFVPDEIDDQYDPYIQFYGLGMHAVGDFYLATTMLYHTAADNDHLEVGLAYSTDTFTWHRPFRDQYILPHGKEGEWDWGQTRQAVNIVEKDDMWWLYYGGLPCTHYDQRGCGYSGIGLAQMPIGRVISARSRRSKGKWTVGPLKLSGRELFINAISFNNLQATILNEQNEPLPGFISTPVRGDGIELPLEWTGGKDLSSLDKCNVKVQFDLHDAEIFGFTCR